MTCVDFSAVVDAYVDHELAAHESAAADAHVERCRACRGVVEERLSLRRVLSALPYHPAPDRLRASIASRTRPRYGVPRRLLPLAAGIAAVVALGGGVAGVRTIETARSDAAVSRLAETAVDAHVRVLQSGRLYDVVSTDQHTVKPWFLGRIDFAPPVEDLSSAGFPLAGGRVDALDGQPEAALIYMRRLHPIDVFIRPSDDRDSSARAWTIRGFRARHWTSRHMTFWAVSDLADDELDAFVEALRRSAQ